MGNRFFTKEQFNNLFAAEMNAAADVYELRKKDGIADYILGNYDFVFVSDSRDKLQALADFLIENYGFAIREITQNRKTWELSGDATEFPVDEDNLMFWAIDLYCKGYEFDSRLEGYGAVADPGLGFPNMEKDLFEHYFELGLDAYNKRNLGMAIIHWSTAIKINPEDPNTWYSRAIAKDELYTWKAARSDYDRSIELAPGFVAAIVNRASNKDEAGEYEEAIKDYSRAIELEPDSAMAYFNRGNSKFNSKDKGGACKDWLRAMELGAEYAEERINANCK